MNNTIRACIAAAGLAALSPIPAAAVDSAYSGSWYTPAEAGSGYNLEIFSDTRALLFWYVYDAAGEPVWLYSEGEIDGERIDFDVYYSDGMRFGDLQAADKNMMAWGTLSMEFSGCNTATISYQSTLTGVTHSPVGSGTRQVERVVNVRDLPCRNKGAGLWSGRHFDPTLNGGAGAWSDLEGVLTDDGRVYFNSLASEEVMAGTYEVTVNGLEFDFETCEEGGSACFNSQGTAAFGDKDWIRGTATSSQFGTQPFELTYVSAYDRGGNLAGLAGSYTVRDPEPGVVTTVTVQANGALSGSDNQGCTFQGQLSLLDEDFNAYGYQGTVSGCTTDSWSGVAVHVDDLAGDGKVLSFRVVTNESAEHFELGR